MNLSAIPATGCCLLFGEGEKDSGKGRIQRGCAGAQNGLIIESATQFNQRISQEKEWHGGNSKNADPKQ
jgi:hypothetical protein